MRFGTSSNPDGMGLPRSPGRARMHVIAQLETMALDHFVRRPKHSQDQRIAGCTYLADVT